MRLSLHQGGVATGTLARVTGGLAGLGIVIAAVSPVSGVPPRGGSSAPAPAQLEVSVLPTGEFDLSPTLEAMPPTAFPSPGERGGPALSVKVRNITGTPLKISVRLISLAPALDDAARVRGSVAGAVVLDGSLRRAGNWSRAVGMLGSNETTTLRLKFKLLPGLSPDLYFGRLDVRQLEIRGVKLNGAAATHSVMREVPDPSPKPGSEPGGASAAAPSPPTAAPRPTTAPAPVATSAPPENGATDQSGNIPEGENAAGLE